MSRRYEVIVIGAGAAGLAAAAELARAGRSALVLEARERVGGRCWTLTHPGLAAPVELGAEFVHGRPAATLSLMRETGIAAVDAPIFRLAMQSGKLRPRGDDLFTRIERAMRRHAKSLARRDLSFEAFLERRLRGLPEEARTFARMRVQGYDAAEPARASARAIVEEWSAEEAAEEGHFRPAGGYGALMDALAGALAGSTVELRLGTVVRAVRWKRGAVTVEARARGKPFRATASRAIVALPLGVLQSRPGAPGAVRFTPALDAKRRALEGLVSGAVVRMPLLFHTPFWEELEGGRYRDVTFFHSPAAAFPTFWTAHPARAPLLVAWAGGPKALRLAGASMPALTRAAVASLTSLFGASAGIEGRLEAAWAHDWQRDPYARGAYSYVAVGGHRARWALAAPLQRTLYFAGEAADYEGEHGTVAGALRSGARAAREILRDMMGRDR